ncbi:MAG TPA: outer membrane lipoprotein carrier protein LolA [Thermoanaerobaculia bacterium]|nr:outer membrane lipoprotein carrier protein LolA [Thermoanaerobaculia bacterium]
MHRLIPLALGLLLLSTVAGAESLPNPRDPNLAAKDRLTTLIERVKIEQAKVQTLEASFTQRQENELLLAPEESKGVFSYRAPNLVRWEYQTPKPITLLIDGKSMSTWYHDLARVEEMTIGRYSEKVLKYLGASGSLEALLEYFEVQVAFPNDVTAPYRLDLSPRFERIAKRLTALTIWIDAARFVPTRLRYETPGGGVTEYSFDLLKINPVLPESRFRLDLPQNVQVRVIELEKAQ